MSSPDEAEKKRAAKEMRHEEAARCAGKILCANTRRSSFLLDSQLLKEKCSKSARFA
ncbi:MAG TPA: hypothetical protein VGP47_07520 [Parachlamydiaceae bacterium]|nr:hypothetical protein [Parachlamydiaceae bacterium]